MAPHTGCKFNLWATGAVLREYRWQDSCLGLRTSGAMERKRPVLMLRTCLANSAGSVFWRTVTPAHESAFFKPRQGQKLGCGEQIAPASSGMVKMFSWCCLGNRSRLPGSLISLADGELRHRRKPRLAITTVAPRSVACRDSAQWALCIAQAERFGLHWAASDDPAFVRLTFEVRRGRRQGARPGGRMIDHACLEPGLVPCRWASPRPRG